MAKRTLSFGDYEEPTWEEYTGEDPPVGRWFNATVNRGRYDEESDSMVFICEIADGDFKGWGRAWYAPFEGARKFKFHTIVKALQGGLTKDVTLDWENDKAVEAWLKKQRPIRIKIGKYNDRISVDRVAPLLEAVGAPGTASTKASAVEAAPEPVEDDEPVEDYTEEELTELSLDYLEEILVEEFEVGDDDMPEKGSGRGAAAKYKKALIAAILAEQEADEDGDEGDEESEDGDPEDEDFEDGFDGEDEEGDEEPEPEPEPEPAKPARRSRAAKAAPAKAEAAPAATTRRRRR